MNMTSQNGNEENNDFQPEEWLEEFIDLINGCIEAHSPMGPTTWRYGMEEELHHLIISPTTVKLVGGEWDGEEVVPGFSLDVDSLLSLFDEIEAVYWKHRRGWGRKDEEGPRLSIEGIYQGRDVWLRILAEPWEDDEPGMELDVSDTED